MFRWFSSNQCISVPYSANLNEIYSQNNETMAVYIPDPCTHRTEPARIMDSCSLSTLYSLPAVACCWVLIWLMVIIFILYKLSTKSSCSHGNECWDLAWFSWPQVNIILFIIPWGRSISLVQIPNSLRPCWIETRTSFKTNQFRLKTW
jgi:hypothetical protein